LIAWRLSIGARPEWLQTPAEADAASVRRSYLPPPNAPPALLGVSLTSLNRKTTSQNTEPE
jgi:hypothetical protein